MATPEPFSRGVVLAFMPPRAPLATLAQKLSRCTLCAEQFSALGHTPRPVARLSNTAKICVCGQAPGTRVHASGLPFDDRSGERLREWMGIDREQFYDASAIATVPMAFCFPGQDKKGGDLPPPSICAKHWHAQLFAAMPQIKLFLLIGYHAQRWQLKENCQKSLTANMKEWRKHMVKGHLALPHPSWRNNGWLRQNPWFANELLPELQQHIRKYL